jgi:hypothetical protein
MLIPERVGEETEGERRRLEARETESGTTPRQCPRGGDPINTYPSLVRSETNNRLTSHIATARR